MELTERDAAALSQATTTAAASSQPSRVTPARLHTAAAHNVDHTATQATTPIRRPAGFDGGDSGAGHGIFDGAATTGPPIWSIWSSPTLHHGNGSASGGGKASGGDGSSGVGTGRADGPASENDDPNSGLHSPSHSALGTCFSGVSEGNREWERGEGGEGGQGRAVPSNDGPFRVLKRDFRREQAPASRASLGACCWRRRHGRGEGSRMTTAFRSSARRSCRRRSAASTGSTYHRTTPCPRRPSYVRPQ